MGGEASKPKPRLLVPPSFREPENPSLRLGLRADRSADPWSASFGADDWAFVFQVTRGETRERPTRRGGSSSSSSIASSPPPPCFSTPARAARARAAD